MICVTGDDSRKQAAMLCFFFKLRFNYLLPYLPAICVGNVDVNLGYMHLSIIVKLTLKFIHVTW